MPSFLLGRWEVPAVPLLIILMGIIKNFDLIFLLYRYILVS